MYPHSCTFLTNSWHLSLPSCPPPNGSNRKRNVWIYHIPIKFKELPFLQRWHLKKSEHSVMSTTLKIRKLQTPFPHRNCFRGPVPQVNTKPHPSPQPFLSRARTWRKYDFFPRVDLQRKSAVLPDSKQAQTRTVAKLGTTENKGNQNDLVQHPESVVLGIGIRWSSSSMVYYNMCMMTQ